MRQGLAGPECVLVDPEQIAKATGVAHAINYFVPSWDGATMAYGICAGGSKDASLILLDIASAKTVGAPAGDDDERRVEILLRLDGHASYGVGSTAQQGYRKETDLYSFVLWQLGRALLPP